MNFFSLLTNFTPLFSYTSSVCISMASGPEDAGAAYGRVRRGVKGRDMECLVSFALACAFAEGEDVMLYLTSI